MKPKLFKLPCGDWIPVELVVAIICQKETATSKPFVEIVLNEGKLRLYCPTSTNEEAEVVANSLGEVVNEYRGVGYELL